MNDFSEIFGMFFACFVISMMVAVVVGMVAVLCSLIGIPAFVVGIAFFIGYLYVVIGRGKIKKTIDFFYTAVANSASSAMYNTLTFVKGLFTKKTQTAAA